MKAYTELEHRFRRLSALSDAGRMLHWDASVHMPAAAAPARAEQLAELKLVRHEILTAADLVDLIGEAGEETAGDWWRAANVSEMHRLRVHAAAVEPDLVEAMTKQSSACEMIWREARPANDFAALQSARLRVYEGGRELTFRVTARGQVTVEELGQRRELQEYRIDDGRVDRD